jgi:hypothetical protein
MKKLLPVILAQTLAQGISAQTRIFNLSDSTADRPSVAELDANFRSAVHSDSALTVFKSDTDRELLITAYQAFVNKMSKYLTDHGFKWEQPTRIFNRFYMRPDGTIEYYIYKVLGKDAAVTEAKYPPDQPRIVSVALVY